MEAAATTAKAGGKKKRAGEIRPFACAIVEIA